MIILTLIIMLKLNPVFGKQLSPLRTTSKSIVGGDIYIYGEKKEASLGSQTE
jgi:hypothetical protein